jgi:hypothetical protein
LSFNKAWVASCVTTPKQDDIQKSNTAIYDINTRKWLNIDTSEVETNWISNIIQQSTKKKTEELSHAYLDLVITDASKRADILCRYINGGATEPAEIWKDLGNPDQQTRATIRALCKAEFDLDANLIFSENSEGQMNEEQPAYKQPTRENRRTHSDTIEPLIRKIVAEDNHIKKCIEEIESKLAEIS